MQMNYFTSRNIHLQRAGLYHTMVMYERMKSMTIETLGEGRVLVSLKPWDIDLYHININKLNLRDADTKESLKTLMSHALKESGINPQGRAVLVEAMPHKEGMLILITVDFVKKLRKIYKVKKPSMLPACRFKGAEGLLSCVEKLVSEDIHLGGNSLWKYKDDLYLIFSSPIVTPRARAVLSEFSLCQSLSMVRIARIKEAGKILADKNAVEQIGKAMAGG